MKGITLAQLGLSFSRSFLKDNHSGGTARPALPTAAARPRQASAGGAAAAFDPALAIAWPHGIDYLRNGKDAEVPVLMLAPHFRTDDDAMPTGSAHNNPVDR